MKKITILLIVFIVLPVFSYAADGVLTLEKGKIRVRHNLIDSIFSKKGQKIDVYNGDTIQTSLDTKVKIEFTARRDETILYSNTFFKIEEVSKDKSFVSLPIGKGKFKVKKSLKKRAKRRFRLKTAHALIGVKGTEFIVATEGKDTNLLTLEGIVTMSSVEVPNVMVEIPLHQASKVTGNSMPTAPVRVPKEVRQNIVRSEGTQAFENVSFGSPIKIKTTKTSKKANAKKKLTKEIKGKNKKSSPTPAESSNKLSIKTTAVVDIDPDKDESIDHIQDTMDDVDKTVKIVDSVEKTEDTTTTTDKGATATETVDDATDTVDDATDTIDKVNEATETSKTINLTIINN